MTLRGLRNRAMLAMLIGCGLRCGELFDLTVESLQQREEDWVIADLVGKGGTCAPFPFRHGLRRVWTRGRWWTAFSTDACSGPSTKPAECGTMV